MMRVPPSASASSRLAAPAASETSLPVTAVSWATSPAPAGHRKATTAATATATIHPRRIVLELLVRALLFIPVPSD